MSALDFLFEGKPPASVTTYGQTVESMPRWLSDYTQGLIARGNAVAAEPFQMYGGPRVASFSPTQQQAWDMTRSNMGAWRNPLSQSQSLFQGVGASSPVQAAAPYLSNASEFASRSVNEGNSGLSFAQPYVQQGAGLTQQGAGLTQQGAGVLNQGLGFANAGANYTAQALGPGMGAAYASAPWLASAGQAIGSATAPGMGASSAANPYMALGMGATAGAMGPGTGGLSAASPYMTQAGGRLPQSVNDYMSPYVDNVINRSRDLAMRTWNEQLMPQISDTFTNAGQFGSTRMAEIVGRGARDLTENVQSQAGAALDQAYRTAGDQFLADQGRLAQIGATAGQLGATDRASALDAARQYGAFGQMAGQFGQADQAAMLDAASRYGAIGSTAGQFGQADQAARLQGGQQMGQFGSLVGNLAGQFGQLGGQMGNFGQNFGQFGNIVGNLGQQQQGALQQAAQLFGQLGATQGTLTNQTGQLRLDAGRNMGALAEAMQALGIRDSAALDTIGQQEQAFRQRNLDTAYQDFLEQRNYPRETVDWMSSLIRGMPYNRATTTSNTGPASVYQPSPLSQLAAFGTALGGWREANRQTDGG